MKVTRKSWNEYISRLSKLNEEAGKKMTQYVEQYGIDDSEKLIAYANSLIVKYCEGSSELACQMYDAMAAAEKANVPPAEPAELPEYREVAKMVNATKKSTKELARGTGRLVKRASADTTLKNAIRDGAEFAWIPNGDTCAFCVTLASRGWQRISKKALKNGHAEHIHANCDCQYAIRFNKKTNVEGYDPDEYLEQYNAAGGDINKMRRIDYAANRERINSQKRAAYAKRELDKISASGENQFNGGFSKANLEKHFGEKGKHTDKYVGWTPEKYNEEALKLVQSSTSDDILGYKTKELSVVRYRRSTNDFVKGYPKTGIATMFKPKDGEEYFKRRLRKEEGIQHD